MSKKILVISTSPRKGGNSDALADEFIRAPGRPGTAWKRPRCMIKPSGSAGDV